MEKKRESSPKERTRPDAVGRAAAWRAFHPRVLRPSPCPSPALPMSVRETAPRRHAVCLKNAAVACTTVAVLEPAGALGSRAALARWTAPRDLQWLTASRLVSRPPTRRRHATMPRCGHGPALALCCVALLTLSGQTVAADTYSSGRPAGEARGAYSPSTTAALGIASSPRSSTASSRPA